jgi:hypothetical protein
VDRANRNPAVPRKGRMVHLERRSLGWTTITVGFTPATVRERRLGEMGQNVCMTQRDVKFGWLSPVIGNKWSDYQPIVVFQERHILPTAMKHFDSLWVADHFYGFDAKTDPFLEAWTTLTWLAAKFPNVLLCHHVLGHGYRPPALTAKMAATLRRPIHVGYWRWVA